MYTRFNSSDSANGDDIAMKPFEEYKDQLFTDYAMQLFNAHCSDNNSDLVKYLIESFEDEAEDNAAFLPGLVFGCMVHMLMLAQVVSLEKGIPLSEVTSSYTNLYQKNRLNLSKMLGNRPEYAKEVIQKIIDSQDQD